MSIHVVLPRYVYLPVVQGPNLIQQGRNMEVEKIKGRQTYAVGYGKMTKHDLSNNGTVPPSSLCPSRYA